MIRNAAGRGKGRNKKKGDNPKIHQRPCRGRSKGESGRQKHDKMANKYKAGTKKRDQQEKSLRNLRHKKQASQRRTCWKQKKKNKHIR